jgi:DNA polymerase (family 10)
VQVLNADVARVFNEIADLLDIQGGNQFRVRAYRNAARTLSNLPVGVQSMLEENRDLTELPGIGADLAGKIGEVVSTGTCALHEQLQGELPPMLHQLLTLPGLGPKRVKRLYDLCHIGTLEELEQAARAGLIGRTPGFGSKTEQRILAALEQRRSKVRRFRLADAEAMAAPLLSYLRASTAVQVAQLAGSLRRACDTVGDIDVLVCSAMPRAVIQRFIAFEGASEVVAHGATRASLVLRQGIQIDLRVMHPRSYGSALHYFTGSKAHNIAVRKLAQANRLKINEYGVFSGNKRLAGDTEEAVFRTVGLPWIAPELREDRGEIAAAMADRLPHLLTLADLQGDLHTHTLASDGQYSMEAMAQAAQQAGLSYLAITDHSHRLALAHGLDPGRVAQQIDQIDALNATLSGFTVLKGIEVDILEDGSLDFPDQVLARLDVVVVAVHSAFGLSRERQTGRILRALDHPYCSLLAHPSGRLLLERAPYDVDMARVIAHAKQRTCFLELNAQPSRLDLDDSECRRAKDAGVIISINSDAHSTHDFSYLRHGVNQGRRGWLEASDVLNTRPIAEVRALLHAARGR